MKYLLAIDLETTGLDVGWHEITQIGAILLDNKFNEIDSFESLVRISYPERGRENKIKCGDKTVNVFELTNISEESLTKAPILDEVISGLNKMVLEHIDNLKVISLFGQNVSFDKSFLEEAYSSSGLKWPFDYHVVDLASFYIAFKYAQTDLIPDKFSLKQITTDFNTRNERPHNAMSDIRTTVEVARKILNRLSTAFQPTLIF